MDRITPSTIIGAFVKAGIVPLDRGAIDESQLIPAMFPAVQNINGTVYLQDDYQK